jgi:hypothetical protein
VAALVDLDRAAVRVLHDDAAAPVADLVAGQEESFLGGQGRDRVLE